MKLGDCARQTISIGALQFSAVGYGDIISPNESMQQKPNSIDKEGRSRCATLAISAGIASMDLGRITSPPENRVARSASDPRLDEWKVSQPLTKTTGGAQSRNEKTMVRLRHDIARPIAIETIDVWLFLRPHT